MDQDSQQVSYPILNKGVVNRLDPSLLQAGQFQTAQNITSIQEGSVSSRPGRKYLGRLPAGANDPIRLAKLPVPAAAVPIFDASFTTPILITCSQPHGFHNGSAINVVGVTGNLAANGSWSAAVIDGNQFYLIGSVGSAAYVNGGFAVLQSGDVSIRYAGVGDTIYRSLDFFQSNYSCATGVMGGQEPFLNRWSMAPYSAGSTGQPQAFFATHGGMLRDSVSISSAGLGAPLQPWGIIPGLAAASATVDTTIGSYKTITGAMSAAGLIWIIAIGHGYTTGQRITISGVTGTTEANGDWIITVIDADSFTLNGSVFTNAYVSGGKATPTLYVPVTNVFAATTPGQVGSGPNVEVYAPAHGFKTGDVVTITGVTGGPGSIKANGTFAITTDDSSSAPLDNFFLNNTTAGPNDYVSGGQIRISGPDTHQQGAGLYDYVFCYRDVATGNQGNPSPLMDRSLWIDSENQAITVTVWGTAEANISQTAGDQSIVIYRHGGGLSGGIYREVGRVTNPGVDGTGTPLPVTFTDSVPDIQLLYANQAEFDNGPPVTSTLRYPINAVIQSGSPDLDPGWKILTLSAAVYNIITIGTTVFVGPNAAEACVVADIPSLHSSGNNRTILVYLQLTHTAGEPVLIDAITGQPCSIAVQAFDSLLVAGDPNNPHVLYKSKTGMPESFPVIDALGNPGSINVGSPSNPIMNVCEFRGKILSLNLTALYEVEIFQGILIGPGKTPSERGLCAPWAWCKSPNAVYYLAWDGIWMWDGGQSRKLTEAIDPIFHGMAVNGIAPVDYTLVKCCRMEYYRNQVFFLYRSAVNKEGKIFNYVLRYDVLYDRWIPESHNIVPFPTIHQSVTEFFREDDTEFFIFARADPGGAVISQYDAPGVSGFTDEFTDIFGTNGVAFDCFFQTGSFRPKDAASMQLFQDALLELQSQAGGTSALMYYDFSVTADSVDQFTIASTGGVRKTVPLPLQLSGTPALPAGKEAFAVATGIGWTSGAQVTVFSFGLRFLDRDQIQSGMGGEWQNLGTNTDKRLSQLHLEHNTGGNEISYRMDIRYGINGTQQANDVAVFALSSSEKTTVTLPIPEAGFPNGVTICKSVRLRAAYNLNAASPQQAPGNTFRLFYKPSFDFTPLGPDIVLFTDWVDFSYPCEKVARNLLINVSTGGIPAVCTVQGDGADIASFTITTTDNDRRRMLAFPITGAVASQPIAKLFRLVSAPGPGGKFQLYDFKIDFTPEPCMIMDWDSYDLSLGFRGWKFLKQYWVSYTATAPVTLTILTDTGRFFSVALPPQVNRSMVRGYLPDATGTSPVVLNKSKMYRFQVTSTAGFKFYLEGSGIEFAPVGGQQRSSYSMLNFSEALQFRSEPSTLAGLAGVLGGV